METTITKTSEGISMATKTKQDIINEAKRNANEQKMPYYVFETVHGYGALSFRPVDHVGGSALLSDVIEVKPSKA